MDAVDKMDDHLVHIIPSHQPTKMDVLPKTFVEIILVAKWLVQHSGIRPPTNRDRQPLPSLLYLSFGLRNFLFDRLKFLIKSSGSCKSQLTM